MAPGGPWLLLLVLSPSECYGDFGITARLSGQNIATRKPTLLVSAAPQTRSSAAIAKRTGPLMAAAASGRDSSEGPRSGLSEWVVKYRSWLLLLCLIVHKVTATALHALPLATGPLLLPP